MAKTSTSLPVIAPDLALSFVICTRNDGYMGNPMWRLQTSLNYLATQAAELKRLADVEVIVADWGSEVPVHKVVQLSAVAADLTTFLVVTPELAAERNRDSPFAEVFPINAAVRRARGRYIARIDQDTLVTASFLKKFFARHGGEIPAKEDSSPALMFSARKQIPYSYVKREVSQAAISRFIEKFGSHSAAEEGDPFYSSPVGVLMAPRSVWNEARGYDETLIYYWYMDLDFTKRVALKHPVRNFGQESGYDIFHLEHFPLWRWRGTHRKLNPEQVRSRTPEGLTTNDEGWGLAKCDLPMLKAEAFTGTVYNGHAPLLWQGGLWMWLHRARILVARTARLLRPRRP